MARRGFFAFGTDQAGLSGQLGGCVDAESTMDGDLFTFFQPLMGERGGKAAERLMGLILILLAVQMLEEGVRMFLVSL